VSDLFWPGAERADPLLSDAAFLDAMVAVEQAWLDALVDAGVAPAGAELPGQLGPDDLPALARAAEAGGNPAQPVVTLLRERSGCAWVHRGLTSQDVVDTALALCLRDIAARLCAELRSQMTSLADLADTHRDSLMAGRTLTQHAVPTTFGRKAAGWLDGVLAAAGRLDDLALPAQLGGAAGTLSAVVEMAGSVDAASVIVGTASRRLGLEPSEPWHTSRAPVTAAADALVACTDAWGRIATDITTLARPEIAELAERSPGGSSTMPHKQNPVLSVLLRRAALTAPPLAAILHAAAAIAGDERPDGAWHAEWATLRDLGRRTVVAASHATEILGGLRVDAARMAATARAHWDELTAERDAIAQFADFPSRNGDYLGASDRIIDSALGRARTFLEEDQ